MDSVIVESETNSEFDNPIANPNIENEHENNEIIVLDPEHPLLVRFQDALNNHLKLQIENVNLDLRDNEEEIKRTHNKREDVGLDLYRLQQELAMKQIEIEKLHYDISKNQIKEQEKTEMLTNLKGQFRNYLDTEKGEILNMNELQSKVENNDLKIFYLDLAESDLRSDIKIMHRATKKCMIDGNNSETNKKRQDIYINRLVKQVDHLKERKSVLLVQIKAQDDLITETAKSLSEARMETETLEIDKKQVFMEWNTSILGMRRRDEALAIMVDALKESKKTEKSLKNEILGFKASIKDVQNKNENLTSILRKNEATEIKTKKCIQTCQEKYESIKADYVVYQNLLDQTEKELDDVNHEIKIKEKSIDEIRKKIENVCRGKVKKEEETNETLQQKLTRSKSAQYTLVKISKNDKLRHDIEKKIAEVENDIAKIEVSINEFESNDKQKREKLSQLECELKEKSKIMEKSQQKIHQNNSLIERKQSNVDLCNKKLELLISKSDGFETGPLEIEIHSLQKSIENESEKIEILEQSWLRSQVELVKLYESKSQVMQNNNVLRKRLIVLEKHKHKIEKNIQDEISAKTKHERSTRETRHKVKCLNVQLNNNLETCNNLEKGNVLIETSFISELREEEKESVEMQGRLNQLQQDKETIVESLVEAERQIMLWEKKTRLMKETKEAIDTDVGQGELHDMKADVHRMKVTLTGLVRQQEELIKQMEKSVARRDTIATRGAIRMTKIDTNNTLHEREVTLGHQRRKITLTKRNIKEILKNLLDIENSISEKQQQENSVIEALQSVEVNLNQFNLEKRSLHVECENMENKKKYMFCILLIKQQIIKWHQQLKNKKYKCITASEQECMEKNDKIKKIVENIKNVVVSSTEIFPVHKVELDLVLQVIKWSYL